MKKLSLIIFCLSIISIIANAGVRVALVGNSSEADKLADLVLVRLSNDNDNLVMLERKAIEQVRQEHKLAAWSHNTSRMIRIGKLLSVDIFAVLHIDKKESFLVVFNAKNGTRLIDGKISGKSFEKITDSISDYLIKAVKKLCLRKNLRKITLFSIRNVELPRQYGKNCRKFASKLTSMIGRLPDFAIIESRYIGLINQERELTSLTSALSQAAFLLNVDFYKSNRPDHSLVKLEVVKSGGNSKTFSIECRLDKLQIPEDDFTEIVSYMRQENLPPKTPPSVEAARYYEEFIKLYKTKRYRETLANIEAAVAYDSFNRRYRRCLIQTLAAAYKEYYDEKTNLSAEEKINRYLDRMERLDRLISLYKFERTEFSIYYGPLLGVTNGFDPLNGNHKVIPEFSSETKQRISRYHHRYVNYIRKKYKLEYWTNPEVKLTSCRKMRLFDRDINELKNMCYPTLDEYWAQFTILLRLYLRKTAQTTEDITEDDHDSRVLSWSLWNRFFVCFKNIPVNNPQFKELRKTAKIGMKHPWPFVRLNSSFALYLAESKENPSASKMALKQFIAHMKTLFESLPSGRNNNSLINLYSVANWISHGTLPWVKIPDSHFPGEMKNNLLNIMMERHEMYFSMLKLSTYNYSPDTIKQLYKYLNSGKWKIIGNEKRNSAIAAAKEKRKLFDALHLKMSSDNKANIDILPFKFTRLAAFNPQAVNAVISDSNDIYWIAFDHKSSSIKAYSYDMKSQKIKKIGKAVSVMPESIYVTRIAVGKKYLAFSSQRNHFIIIYNLNSGETIKFTTPFKNPKDIAIVDNTLLVWCTKDNYLLKYQLPTLKYTVVYSANRRHSDSDIFNNQKVTFDMMIPDRKRKRIIVILSGWNLKQPGWWYYYPNQERFEYVGRYPSYSPCRWTKLGEDKILLPLANYCFVLNLKNDTKKLLFYALYPDAAKARGIQKDFERYYGAKALVTLKLFMNRGYLSAGTIAGNSFWTNTPWHRINLLTGQKTYYIAPNEINDCALLLHTIPETNNLLLVNCRGIFVLRSTQDAITAEANDVKLKQIIAKK